ncbi:MAG: DUF2156 domain-containing protein [Pirellulales bacterium]|nr:DUF2156 domain-containing protein [Pirellulales bacterium]
MNVSAADHPASRAPSADASAARLEELAWRHGQTYDSYLATEQDREHFWSSDGSGVLGFVRRRRYVHVVGGLLAPVERRPLLLTEFTRYAAQQRWQVMFYNIGPTDLPLLRYEGYEVTKCGEEPLIDLRSTTWKGKNYEWVRRQENYCLRQGAVCEEVAIDPSDQDYRERVAPELSQIAHAHVTNTPHRRELSVFVSQFDPLRLGRRRLFVARTAQRIEALIVCNPAEDGRFWAIETYRRRPDAPRGIVPFAMMQTARQLQRERIETLSLSLIPCLRCEKPLDGDSWLMRVGQTIWWERMNWVFDMRGIYHYKSRFRPQFREMFIAARPKLNFFAAYDFISLWGIHSIGPTAAAQHYWTKFTKLARRATMAAPDEDAQSSADDER